jgi:hypothetical protein
MANVKRYKNLHIAAELAQEKASNNLEKANAGKWDFEFAAIEAYQLLKHAAEMLTEASKMDLGGQYV